MRLDASERGRVAATLGYRRAPGPGDDTKQKAEASYSKTPALAVDSTALELPSVEVAYRFEGGPVGVLSREGKPAIRKAEHVLLLVVDQFRVAALLQQG